MNENIRSYLVVKGISESPAKVQQIAGFGPGNITTLRLADGPRSDWVYAIISGKPVTEDAFVAIVTDFLRIHENGVRAIISRYKAALLITHEDYEHPGTGRIAIPPPLVGILGNLPLEIELTVLAQI